MDYREELLTMKDQTLENMDSIVDQFFAEHFDNSEELRDELAGKLADMICETIDPAGF